jgi:hypothetical protein
MKANVKPLTHWIIYKGYSVRFGQRSPQEVNGVLNTESGAIPFRYEPQSKLIHLPDGDIQINEHGWEMDTDS